MLYTQEQQSAILHSRQQFVDINTKIENLKAELKDEIEALVETLKLDKKEQKEEIKAIKTGFKIYYKASIEETEKLAEEAIEIARLKD